MNCFFTCTNGIYDDLVDIYKYCCRRAYPDWDVVVQVGTRCDRFLRELEYEYVHVTDIDILILPQKKTHKEYYLSHAHNGASYLRGCKNGSGRRWIGKNSRICCGEFGLTKEYYERTSEARFKYRQDSRSKEREFDEVIFCQILSESGYVIPDKPYHFPDESCWNPSYRDLHIHDWRNNKYLKWQPEKEKIKALFREYEFNKLVSKLSAYWKDYLLKIKDYAFN